MYIYIYIYIWKNSLGLEYRHLFCDKQYISLAFRTQTNFVLGSLSLGLINPKLIGARFAQSQGTNIHIGFVSLGLPDLNTIWPAFTFPRPGFSKIYWGLFRSASLHQHKHMYVGFVSVGLLDSNKFWQGFPFAQPGFSKIYWGSFRSASRHQHIYIYIYIYIYVSDCIAL